MKRVFTALAALAALLSCTQRYVPKETNYYVDDAGTCLFTAEVEQLSGEEWTWSAACSKVGVYADDAANVVFQPRVAYDGTTGWAQLMGPAVKGQAYAYLPYRKGGSSAAQEGCLELPLEQSYCTDAVSQIEMNTPVLVAAADENGHFDFRYLCGALHIKVKIEFLEKVERLTLTANEPVGGYMHVVSRSFIQESYSVSVVGIDLPCTESNPLDVWVMLPEGTFTGLYVTVAGATESISTVLEGEVCIKAGDETEAVAQEKKNDYHGSDFDAEEVDYD